MSKPDLTTLEGMTLHGEEPIFNEPWEAQAFAITLALHQQGKFTWDEWAQALSKAIHDGEERPYYKHWLSALEAISIAKGLTAGEAISKREEEWHQAAARTPHGEPINL